VHLIEAGVVVPRVSGTLEERLCELHAGICEVIAQTEPALVVVEELYTTYKNPRSALLMGHARGVLCLASAQAGIAVHTLGHARVKRALVGSGSARKEQVGAMVRQLLGLRRAPKPHDVSDALALALAFLNILDHQMGAPGVR
jgi:crossover junction endodeoxyribonuclease RuvC